MGVRMNEVLLCVDAAHFLQTREYGTRIADSNAMGMFSCRWCRRVVVVVVVVVVVGCREKKEVRLLVLVVKSQSSQRLTRNRWSAYRGRTRQRGGEGWRASRGRMARMDDLQISRPRHLNTSPM